MQKPHISACPVHSAEVGCYEICSHCHSSQSLAARVDCRSCDLGLFPFQPSCNGYAVCCNRDLHNDPVVYAGNILAYAVHGCCITAPHLELYFLISQVKRLLAAIEITSAGFKTGGCTFAQRLETSVRTLILYLLGKDLVDLQVALGYVILLQDQWI